MGTQPEQPEISPIIGLSWLAVEHTLSFPPLSAQSQAHPDPNRVMAALVKASLNPSRDPKAALIPSPTSPPGSLAPPGLMQFQKWL